jgi:hypothetical protein
VRVYERDELAAHALGRHEDNSGVPGVCAGPLAWSTDGALIAAVQRIKGRLQVSVWHVLPVEGQREPLGVESSRPSWAGGVLREQRAAAP